jgi:hypothetical protein
MIRTATILRSAGARERLQPHTEVILNRTPRFLLASVAFGLLVAPAIAKTWFVGGPGADFDEIQPAIDAAQDGDVILVRPGQYHGFTLSKGVMVAASSTRFSVPPTATDRVVVSGVASGRRAGIAGMSMNGLADVLGYQFLEVSSCQGEVVLEDLELQSPDSVPFFLSADLLLIADCTNVSVTTLQASRGSDASLRGVVHVERSVVRLADCTVQVGKQLTCDDQLNGLEGAPAVEAIDSSVVVAGDATLRAGDGGDAAWSSIRAGAVARVAMR